MTIFSSSSQLMMGRLEETNFHILNRAVITGIGVSLFYVDKYCVFKNKLVAIVLPYCVALAVVLGYIWLTGFVEPVHPNGYRDMALNFSAIYVVIAVGSALQKKWQSKQKSAVKK